jgi:hypothetical protein
MIDSFCGVPVKNEATHQQIPTAQPTVCINMNETSTISSNPSTTNDATSLSVEQLTDVRDVLKGPPLTHRSVLIPFGRQAFLPGRLLPLLASPPPTNALDAVNSDSVATVTSQSLNYDNAKNQEYVVVHNVAAFTTNDSTTTGSCTTRDKIEDSSIKTTRPNDSSSVQMTRQEALDYLQVEIDRLKKKKSSKRHIQPTTTRTATTKPQAPSPLTTQANQTTLVNNAVSNTAALPFIEIREEVDDTGNIIDGHAVNVTQHLHYLAQQQSVTPSEIDGSNTNEESGIHPNNPLREIPAPESALRGEINDDDFDSIHPPMDISTSDESPPIAKTITDEQYDIISRRLEELALLEEQQEQNISSSSSASTNFKKTTVPRSSKTKGWTKGFLNQPIKKQLSIAKQSDVSTKVSSSTTPSSSVAAVASPVVVSSSTEETISNKKVSFTGKDDVQVIPRIGQRSIASELLQQQQSSSFVLPIQNRTAAASSSVDPTKYNAIATTQVVEKKSSTRRRPGTTAPRPPSLNVVRNGNDDNTVINTTNNTSIQSNDVTSEPIKKLSKFAQERQQLRK